MPVLFQRELKVIGATPMTNQAVIGVLAAAFLGSLRVRASR
jgi:hypothetical protein